MQQAVDSKRFYHLWLPDEVGIENDAIDKGTIDRLVKSVIK